MADQSAGRVSLHPCFPQGLSTASLEITGEGGTPALFCRRKDRDAMMKKYCGITYSILLVVSMCLFLGAAPDQNGQKSRIGVLHGNGGAVLRIADSVDDGAADKALSARQGTFLYELVTNINERENGTWRTVSTYIPYLEHYATNNYKAARIANERVGKLEKWRRDEEETKRRLSEALQSLDSGSSSVSNVIEALKYVLVRPEFDKTHPKSLIENKKGK